MSERDAWVMAAPYLRDAGLRAELQLCRVRVLFAVAIAARSAWIYLHEVTPGAAERAAVTLLIALTEVVFSSWVGLRLQRGRNVTDSTLLASVLLDSVLCTADLASNVLWAWPSYRGLLLLPDTMTYLLVLLAASYRASSKLAVASAFATVLGLAATLSLDLQRNATHVAYGFNEMSMYAVMIGFAALLTVVATRRTERLVRTAAEDARRSEQAKRGISNLLQEHHDAVGFLNAALFAAHKIERVSATDVSELRDDLERLRCAITGIKERALGNVVSLEDAEAVDVVQLVIEHAGSYERMVAPMRVSWEFEATPPASVRGGARAFQRSLLNLLVNAKEGDGDKGASLARVQLRDAGGYVCLTVQDNGPGADSVMSKPHGTGTGLRFVRAVASASRGTFKLSSVDDGTIADLQLPRI